MIIQRRLQTNTPNFCTILGVEPFEKGPGRGGLDGWCLNPILVFSLSLNQFEHYSDS